MNFSHFLMIEQPEGGFLSDEVPYVFPVLIAVLLVFQIVPEQILIALSFGFNGERKRGDNPVFCLGLLVRILDAGLKSLPEADSIGG